MTLSGHYTLKTDSNSKKNHYELSVLPPIKNTNIYDWDLFDRATALALDRKNKIITLIQPESFDVEDKNVYGKFDHSWYYYLTEIVIMNSDPTYPVELKFEVYDLKRKFFLLAYLTKHR